MRTLLIGMTASGKTHIGKSIASQTGLAFIDQDDHMESIFHKGEKETIFTVDNYLKSGKKLSMLENTVVASGGGFGIINGVSEMFDLVVFLDASEELIVERILEARKNPFAKENIRRPLIYKNDNIREPDKTDNILETHRERRNLYAANADVTYTYANTEEQNKALESIKELILANSLFKK